jgi:hypothetical protein
MNHLLSFFVTFSLTFTAFSQTQLPNSNFENWSTDVVGKDSLIGWSSSNLIVINPVTSLYKDTSAYQGNFSGNLVTAPFGFVQYSTLGILVNGKATFDYGGGGGGSNVNYRSGGGTPISVKPYELQGYYKTYESISTNKTMVKILLSKFNLNLNKRDTVSYIEYRFHNFGTYDQFAIPLPDLMPGILPDTITTIFYSSDTASLEPLGTFATLFLDSLTLLSNSSQGLKSNKIKEWSVYPNPSNGIFYLSNFPVSQKTIVLFNQEGKRINSLTLENGKVDLTCYPSGTYFIKLDENNFELEKLIIFKE